MNLTAEQESFIKKDLPDMMHDKMQELSEVIEALSEGKVHFKNAIKQAIIKEIIAI